MSESNVYPVSITFSGEGVQPFSLEKPKAPSWLTLGFDLLDGSEHISIVDDINANLENSTISKCKLGKVTLDFYEQILYLTIGVDITGFDTIQVFENSVLSCIEKIKEYITATLGITNLELEMYGEDIPNLNVTMFTKEHVVIGIGFKFTI